MDRKDRATIVTTLRYRDAAAAIDFLCRAFGFQRKMVFPGPDDTIQHAQLTFGNGMIMLSSPTSGGPFDALQVPHTPGTPATQSPYLIVEDVDGHHDRAVAAGAKVVYPLTDEPYGGRGYSCLDPEGNLWNFGSYDPWADESAS
jgi:uncharacterized glyoxalase superfamily protein PhnB